MTQMKPTVEEILKRKIQGHAPERVVWETAKKNAGKHVDVKVFKDGLGPAIDNFRQVCKGALEVKRFYPKLDDRTLKPVKEQKAKIEQITRKYVQICDANEKKPGVTDVQKQAWRSLSGAVQAANAVTINYTKNIL